MPELERSEQRACSLTVMKLLRKLSKNFKCILYLTGNQCNSCETDEGKVKPWGRLAYMCMPELITVSLA